MAFETGTKFGRYEIRSKIGDCKQIICARGVLIRNGVLVSEAQ